MDRGMDTWKVVRTRIGTERSLLSFQNNKDRKEEKTKRKRAGREKRTKTATCSSEWKGDFTKFRNVERV